MDARLEGGMSPQTEALIDALIAWSDAVDECRLDEHGDSRYLDAIRAAVRAEDAAAATPQPTPSIADAAYESWLRSAQLRLGEGL